jgi:hypothetical protein
MSPLFSHLTTLIYGVLFYGWTMGSYGYRKIAFSSILASLPKGGPLDFLVNVFGFSLLVEAVIVRSM